MTRPLDSHTSPIALPLQIDRSRPAPPMIEQLVLQMRHLIEQGDLVAGSRLPSSRQLAADLGVSRTVITEVYGILAAEGYIETRLGAGTFVVEAASAVLPSAAGPSTSVHQASKAGLHPFRLRRSVAAPWVDPEPGPGESSFRLCEPDPTSFPDSAWRTCARAAIAESMPAGYAEEVGDPELRRAIASWVSRDRGLSCTPEEVVVTSGTTQSLDLLARVALEPQDTVALEDPGYRLAQQIFSERGSRILPVAVDHEGMAVETLIEREPPAAVYTTPSHQYPVGSILCYSRRTRLLDWASANGVLVIEDDYDSELRLEGPVLPALRAYDRSDSVVYLGTFSKSLSPSLRIGFVIASSPLREALVSLKTRVDHGTSWPMQRALARYIHQGGLSRHLRRVKRIYRERRDRLVAALEPLPAGAEWIGLAAGLHATLRLPADISALRVVNECARQGALVRRLGDYAISGSAGFDGLVLGYGAPPVVALERMAAVVKEAMARCS